MAVVRKFGIPPVKNQRICIDMPIGCEIIQIEAGRLLAVCDSEAPQVPHYFKVVTTDEEFDAEGARYVGTYWLKGNDYTAFHVFMVH